MNMHLLDYWEKCWRCILSETYHATKEGVNLINYEDHDKRLNYSEY